MRGLLKFFGSLAIIIILVLAFTYGPAWYRTTRKTITLRQWFTNPEDHPDLSLPAGYRCPGAVFLLPTDGYLGFVRGDSWSFGHLHAGLDIFAPTGLNQTPIVAAYDGFLTRESTWKSTVIIRHPIDPLDPTRGQVWTYYTHMADPSGQTSYIVDEIPAGTFELPVKAGDLLGYQGNFSGDPDNPVGIHLHFSVVKSSESGGYLNELEIDNTYDPIPYLGLVEIDHVWRCPEN